MRSFMFILAWSLWLTGSAAAFSNADVVAGFKKTVFGSEFPGFGFQPQYVRKFNKAAVFYVHNLSRKNRKSAVRRFISGLNRNIRGLRVRFARTPGAANFNVYVVDRKDYQKTVRQRVYRGRSTPIRGRCIVRSVFTRAGISRSDAVIVSDEGEALFRRCLIEEILQGLGPLNDDKSLSQSVFNDQSRYTSFTRFDKTILNMLYDRRIRSGDSLKKVAPLLPKLARETRRRIR